MSQEGHYIDKVNVGGTIYKIHDTDTRNNVNTLSNNVSSVNNSLDAINSSIVNLTNKVNTIENNSGSGSGSGGSHDTDDAKHITLKGTTQRIIVKTITNLHVTKQGYVMEAEMKVGDTADYADKPDGAWSYYKGSVKAGDVLKVAVYTIEGKYCYLTDNNNKVTQAFNSTIKYYTTDDLVNIKTINVDTNGTFVCCGVAKRGMTPYILKISTTGNTTTANVLVQSDMTSTDTIYIIKSNLDLNGETLTIPSGCTLKFDGGSISNGIIIGNKTKIDAKKGDNIFSNVRIWGTWNVSEAYSSWLSPAKNGYRIAEVGFKYVWVKFATDANGSGMQNSMFNSNKEVMAYMGIAEGKDVETPSTEATDYIWYSIGSLSTQEGPEYKDKTGIGNGKYLWVVWQYTNGLTITDDNNVDHTYPKNDIAPQTGCTGIGIALQKDIADKTTRYANAYLKENADGSHTIVDPVRLKEAFYWITSKDENHSIKYPYYRVEGKAGVVEGWYPMGALPNGLTSYESYYDADDTIRLRQLLNLKADKTVIEEGVYFVNGDNHVYNGIDINETDYLDGLTIKDVDNKELVINGYLKMIPVRLNSMYRILLINNCNHYKISGSGHLVGDVPEHFGDNGEWAYGLELRSCDYVTIKGITCSLNWGDGISCSNGSTEGAKTPEEKSKMFRQSKHIYEHVTVNYNRRTGFVYLTGNDIVCRSCDFNYNGVYRGCSTFSGVDIEPDFYTNGKYDYVSDITFSNCNFKGNYDVGLRAEHCLNLSVYDCNFRDNNTAIAPRIVRSCNNSITGEVVTGNCNIYSCHFYNNIKLLEATLHSRVNFYNNYVMKSVQCIVGDLEMSKIYNNVFIQPSVLLNLSPMNTAWKSADVEVYNNKIMNLLGPISKGAEQCTDINVHDNTFTYNGGEDGTNYLEGGTFDYPVIKQVPLDQQTVSTGITFRNNIIDDRFYGNISTSYTNSAASKDPNTYGYKKMETQKTADNIVFFKGDKVRTLDQEGIVVVGGRTGLDKNVTVFTAGMTVKANQKVVDSKNAPTKEFYCENDGTLGDTFPTTTTSGNVDIEFLTTSTPVIAWQTTGFLPSDANYPTTFNSKGRRLFKEDGSVVIYNGSAFVEESV